MSDSPTSPSNRPSGARFVALGILSSKVFGLVRETVIAHLFGVGPHADVWRTAMRAPNALQNLLGDQALSAAFIPIYSRMVEEGRHDSARRFAGAILGLLLMAVGLLVTLGVWLAPWIVSVLAAGFLDDAEAVAQGLTTVDRFPRAVQAVRFVFPMTGFLVLAAWALGVLNSHRRFLVPFMAPIAWNVAILSGLGWAALDSGHFETPAMAGVEAVDRWLYAGFFGAMVGGFLQFAVQLPFVWRSMGGIRLVSPTVATRVEGVRDALRAMGPVLAGRGVVQLSIYVDILLASFLIGGAPGAIGFAVTLYNLPLGAFGISIAAAELPELSRANPESGYRKVMERVHRAVGQSTFVIAPSVVGYLLFGLLVVQLIYRRGSFTAEDQWLVYAVLGGYSLGLVASAISRLLQNVFFALRDTKTPARIASVRLAASVTAGVGLMVLLDRWAVAEVFGLVDRLGLDTTKGLHLGAVGLSLSASVGAWAELLLLRQALRRRIPGLDLGLRLAAGHFLVALLAAVPPIALWMWLGESFVTPLAVLPAYIVTYLGWAWWRRTPELELWAGRFLRRR